MNDTGDIPGDAYRRVVGQPWYYLLGWEFVTAVTVLFFGIWWALIPGAFVLRSLALCMGSLFRR